MNTERLPGLLIAVWALVATVVLWLLPKDTYLQGSVAGIIVSVSGCIVAVNAYLWWKNR